MAVMPIGRSRSIFNGRPRLPAMRRVLALAIITVVAVLILGASRRRDSRAVRRADRKGPCKVGTKDLLASQAPVVSGVGEHRGKRKVSLSQRAGFWRQPAEQQLAPCWPSPSSPASLRRARHPPAERVRRGRDAGHPGSCREDPKPHRPRDRSCAGRRLLRSSCRAVWHC
jgi:hypothetical protein